MRIEEINWMAGGPQGAGVDSAANIFGRACGYGGLYVFGKREYHSNIKGLHSYFHLRVSNRETQANINDVDLLAAFDAETVVRHISEVATGGGVIVDENQVDTNVFSISTLPSEFKNELRRHVDRKALGNRIGDFLEDARKAGIYVYTVPYMKLLKRVAAELGIEKISKVTRMINVLTIGISFSLLKYDRDLVEKAVRATFSNKPKIAEMNVVALTEAFNYAERAFKEDFPHKLETAETSEERIFISGNQAVAIGKVLGGCRIQTYYPITPAADESEYLEAHEILKTKLGDGAIVVIQTEDEIAAINSASGAALTGTRAATSTSGPGFSLMVEGLSWVGNSEVPVVITYYQRGAPSTGLPTRFGQADMRFVMHAGHGEFPRIVLASGDIRECFYDAAQAFNYAERYQLPVIHLVDKAMANSSQTYKIFGTDQFKIDRGDILKEYQIKTDPFKRFRFTENGVSPRVFVGAKSSIHWHTGDEHDEVGHISEEPLNRDLMMEKRMKKLETVDKETALEEKVNFFGDMNSKNIVLSWGSPKGAIVEALNLLKKDGFNLAFIQIRMLLPFPKDYISNALRSAERIIDVENNYLGQLGGLVREETRVSPNFYILKYNGRPITTTEIYDSLKNILLGKALERQVLKYGS